MAEDRVTAAGRRERNKQANRQAILDAAQRIFIDSGYDAVTIRDIVRGTELASGTFYNYFDDKPAVFRALVEARVQALTDELVGVRRTARSLDQFVNCAYRVAFTTIIEDPSLYHLLIRNESAVRAIYRDSVLGIATRALEADIRDAIGRGIMPKLDAGWLAAAFFGAGYELGRLLAESERPDPAAAADFATQLFIGGIQSFSAGKPAELKPRVRAVAGR